MFAGAGSSAAQIRFKDRIATRLETRSPFVVKGNVHPFARPRYDQGEVGHFFRMERITMMFKPTDAQQAALENLLEEQQDPASADYHNWLTPEEFAGRFGLSPNDVNKIVSWLQNQGFSVDEVARTRRWVSFSGSAAQVESAFQTAIHEYTVGAQTFFANATDPVVPAAFADVVLGFRSLNNFRLNPRPNIRSIDRTVSPQFTSSVTGNHYLAPADFATIYNLGGLYGGGYDGAGQKIAIMGQTDIQLNDIRAFRSAAGLPANDPQVVLVPGSSDPGVVAGDVEEASLDIEWSGAVARRAQIVFVTSKNGVFDSLQYTVDHNLAPVVSMSYGSCEKNFTPQDAALVAAIGQQANAQGITIIASSGDTGAADCDSPTSRIATHGLAVDIPASLPSVTALGGSEFSEVTTSWSTTNNASYGSALSYIPEVAWNDTALGSLTAGGGGRSIYFSKPSWQTGNGVPNDNARDVPDISLNASGAHDGYLMCSGGSCVNGFRSSGGGLTVVGGTSVGAPAFAGVVAIINQLTNSAQGNINGKLYSLAASAPAVFHDITGGSNQVSCQPGTADCPSGGSIGYGAGVGYDQATGLGSVDVANLVAAWVPGTTVSSTTPAPATAPASIPMPTVAGVTPAAGVQGTTVAAAVSGTNLSAASVSFSGTGMTVLIQPGATDAQIPLLITIAHDALPGPQSITVSTQGGTVTAASIFLVKPAQAPATLPQPISVVEQGTVRSGYAVITPDANSVAPSPTVTFGVVNGGAVQTQSGLLPMPMMTDASLLVDVVPGIGRNLGVALANPSPTTNTITLTLRDEAGSVAGTPVTITLQAQQQSARFVTELLPGPTGAAFRGTLELESPNPFAVLGLRSNGIEFSTLPVTGTAVQTGVPLRALSNGAVGGGKAIILPQFAMAGGWATQVALVNNSGTAAGGRVDIFDTAGNPMPVTLNGVTQSTFSYGIAAGGMFLLAPRDVNGQSPF